MENIYEVLCLTFFLIKICFVARNIHRLKIKIYERRNKSVIGLKHFYKIPIIALYKLIFNLFDKKYIKHGEELLTQLLSSLESIVINVTEH